MNILEIIIGFWIEFDHLFRQELCLDFYDLLLSDNDVLLIRFPSIESFETSQFFPIEVDNQLYDFNILVVG